MATKKTTKKKRRLKKKFKKILLLIVLIVAILLLWKCGIDKLKKNKNDDPDDSTAVTTTAKNTDDSVTSAEETTEKSGPATDENGNLLTDIYLDERLIGALSGIQERLQCKTVFVYDRVTETYLLEVNTREVIHPASITKLWVGLYAQTLIEPDTKITAGDEVKLIKEGSSIAYIKSGKHTLKLSMLIEGMMLPSGNDAAYVIAAACGRVLAKNDELSPEDAISYFMIGLNEYASKLGCKGTKFTEPDGNVYEEHYTTVNDLVLVSEYALKNPLMAEYMKTQSQKVTYASGHSMTWTNTNLLLDPTSEYYCPLAVGLKTGSLEGEYSLMAASAITKDDDARFIIGCLNGSVKSARFADAKLIIDTIENTIGK